MADSNNMYSSTKGSSLSNVSPHMVYLLIDCSSSMEGNPMRQAKDGALHFADDSRERGYRVGLIRFADNANALQNPETGFTDAVQSLVAFGTTNLAEAIDLAIEHLVREAVGQKVMCVVTDGMPDSERKALAQARRAAQNDIQIMVIGTSGADRKFLAKLATASSLSNYVSQDNLEQ
ncbi:MAG TPA: vWA domain-containing protein, partial [Candidatus Saccharimonadia bacterium]|nr:vWA domain-containing protein [Candidatus Saccharimonadia bacterium]